MKLEQETIIEVEEETEIMCMNCKRRVVKRCGLCEICLRKVTRGHGKRGKIPVISRRKNLS